MDEWKSGPDDLSLDCDIKYIADVKEVGRARLYFMPPGKQTNTFSMEATDDGTADEYYGTCHESYYILGGEFAIYWGKDISSIQESTANKLVLKAGDLRYWPPGWKYSAKNTRKVPETFFWGITRPPQEIKRRAVSEAPQWLKAKNA